MFFCDLLLRREETNKTCRYRMLHQFRHDLHNISHHLLLRREELVKQMSVDIESSSKPRKLIRQESIHGLENEQNLLSPRVEGRIYILTEEVSASLNILVFLV